MKQRKKKEEKNRNQLNITFNAEMNYSDNKCK